MEQISTSYSFIISITQPQVTAGTSVGGGGASRRLLSTDAAFMLDGPMSPPHDSRRWRRGSYHFAWQMRAHEERSAGWGRTGSSLPSLTGCPEVTRLSTSPANRLEHCVSWRHRRPGAFTGVI